MSKWWLATVETEIAIPETERRDLRGWSARVADSLIAFQDTVTVRIHVNGRPSVLRMDVMAETAEEGEALARGRIEDFCARLGLSHKITGSNATDDLERIAQFLREPRCS